MAERLAPLRGSAHVFYAYDDVADAIGAADRFFAEGRAARDVCVFFGDDAMASRLAPIDGGTGERTIRHVRPSAIFRTATHGALVTLLQLRDHAVAGALAAGRRVRFVIVPSADATDRDLWDRTEAFEAMFTGHRATGAPLSALCLYDRSRYPHDLIELAGVAHPCLLAHGAIRANDAFSPPRRCFPGARPGRVA